MVARMADTERQPLHLRVPRALHTDLLAYAARTHRNLTGAVVHLLETALRAEQQHEHNRTTH